jgi:lipoyl(octanoyl) transferase
MKRSVALANLGMISYRDGWEIQEHFFNETIHKKLLNRDRESSGQLPEPTQDHLLMCEHPHVYTLGKSGKEEHLLLNPEQLDAVQAEFVKTNRGGDITYHGPGQLVVYPILDLDHYFTDIHRYMRELEEVVIRCLADFGITAGRIKGLTGVWLGDEDDPNARKICAMGVKASRWVTMHGLALNVNTDLDYFRYIVPCGIEDKAVTSISRETGQLIPMDKVVSSFLKHFSERFDCIFTKQEE